MAFTDWVGMQDAATAAKARAVAQNQYSRAQLGMQYGLDANGAVDPSNQLGSIYQAGASAATGYQSGLASSVARGLGTSGGIGARQSLGALNQGNIQQAGLVQNATQQRGYLGIQDQLANTDYQNTTTSIGRGQADELAQKLAANPVFNASTPMATANPGIPASTDPRFSAITPPMVKKNPTIYRTLRNT